MFRKATVVAFKTTVLAFKTTVLAFAIVSLTLGSVQAARKAKMVGIVMPSDARPGERASGSITRYPAAIQGISGLHLEKTSLDVDDTLPSKAVLKGIVIDAGGQKRTADQNFYVDIPAAAKTVHLTFTRDDQQVATVDVPIEASTSAPLLCASGDWINGTEAEGTQSKFRTPSTYCYAGMALIAGDFNGDAQQTKIEVGGETAKIVAESVRYCYWMLPRTAGPGANEVTLHEGTHVVKFRVTVPRLDLLQVLEDEGSTVAETPPNSDAAASDNPNPAPAIPLGIGIGGFGIGGGDEEEGAGVGWGRERRR
jgi:hypothetical protein